MLRFDVETIYKATLYNYDKTLITLRFDVETIYKATKTVLTMKANSCGLM